MSAKNDVKVTERVPSVFGLRSNQHGCISNADVPKYRSKKFWKELQNPDIFLRIPSADPDSSLQVSPSLQQLSLSHAHTLTHTHVPSKSFSGVSAANQSLNGPVPFAVMAATWKLYWLPFSRPAGTDAAVVM